MRAASERRQPAAPEASSTVQREADTGVPVLEPTTWRLLGSRSRNPNSTSSGPESRRVIVLETNPSRCQRACRSGPRSSSLSQRQGRRRPRRRSRRRFVAAGRAAHQRGGVRQQVMHEHVSGRVAVVRAQVRGVRVEGARPRRPRCRTRTSLRRSRRTRLTRSMSSFAARALPASPTSAATTQRATLRRQRICLSPVLNVDQDPAMRRWHIVAAPSLNPKDWRRVRNIEPGEPLTRRAPPRDRRGPECRACGRCSSDEPRPSSGSRTARGRCRGCAAPAPRGPRRVARSGSVTRGR